ncbi:hypothetical protein KIPB_004226, partial [Kipferlia bialata]
ALLLRHDGRVMDNNTDIKVLWDTSPLGIPLVTVSVVRGEQHPQDMTTPAYHPPPLDTLSQESVSVIEVSEDDGFEAKTPKPKGAAKKAVPTIAEQLAAQYGKAKKATQPTAFQAAFQAIQRKQQALANVPDLNALPQMPLMGGGVPAPTPAKRGRPKKNKTPQMEAYRQVPVDLDHPAMAKYIAQLKTAGARKVTRISMIDHSRYTRLVDDAGQRGQPLTPAWHGTSMRNVELALGHGGVTNSHRGVNGQAHGPGVYMASTPQMSYSSDADVAGNRVMLLHYVDMSKATKHNPIVLPDNDSFALRFVFFFTM